MSGQLVELSLMRTQASDCLEEESSRPRRKLPWLVARQNQPKEQRKVSKGNQHADFAPTTNLQSEEEYHIDQSVASTPRSGPFATPHEGICVVSSELISQEESHSLLESDEHDWALSALAKFNNDLDHVASPNVLPTCDETRSLTKKMSIGRKLSGHITKLPSTLSNSTKYSPVGVSETASEDAVSICNDSVAYSRKSKSVRDNVPEEPSTFESALDGLEELMTEALRMAEQGISREQRDGAFPTSHNQSTQIKQDSTSPTGPLQISNSSSQSNQPHRSLSAPATQRWWPRTEPHFEIETPPISPLEHPHTRMDRHHQPSEDADRIPHRKSRDSKAIDWAYVQRPIRRKRSPPSSFSSESGQSVLRHPIAIHGPTTPTPVLQSNKEHYNYLDRNLTNEDFNEDAHYTTPELHPHHFIEGHGRGRRRRGVHQVPPRPRTMNEDVPRQHKDDGKLFFRHFFKDTGAENVRGLKHTPENSSIGPEPADGKLKLGHTELDKLSLKTPRRHHHSLLGRQPFSMSRHHRRQPVARDWNATRKRLTATVACMNTALLGLIIGIYVSSDWGPNSSSADQVIGWRSTLHTVLYCRPKPFCNLRKCSVSTETYLPRSKKLMAIDCTWVWQ